MDSESIEDLIQHFENRINNFHDLVQFARMSKYLEKKSKYPEEEVSIDIDDSQLPDLQELTRLILESKQALGKIENYLDDKEKSLKREYELIKEEAADTKNHLQHLSSQFPVDFGKESKPKYGINVPRKGPVVSKVQSGLARSKFNETSKPSSAAGNRGTSKASNPVPLTRRKINSATTTSLPASRAQQENKSRPQVLEKGMKKTDTNVASSSSVNNAARVNCATSRMAAATISSMQKSAKKPIKSDIKKTTASIGMTDATGKAPAFPVRLTKKLLTMREHQLNRMKSTEDTDDYE